MHIFNRHNKSPGVYSVKESIENLQIKVILNHGIQTLLNIDEYFDKSVSESRDKNAADTFLFKWQEKKFSGFELLKYSDSNNCVTDTEQLYHELITNNTHKPEKVFSYVHEDSFLSGQCNEVLNRNYFNLLELNSCFKKLSLNTKKNVLDSQNMYSGRMLRKNFNIGCEDPFMTMHIMYDNSSYDENFELVLKQQSLLLSLYLNFQQNYLIVSPDVNNLAMNPYQLYTMSNIILPYKYAIELDFGEENDEELVTLLTTLKKKWDKKQKEILTFETPQLGRKRIHCVLEIVTASDFEMDNLYIECNMKVPEALDYNDSLFWRTHVSKSTQIKDNNVWQFGHIIDLDFELAADLDVPKVQLFFEVISLDRWGRHRTEGYSYFSLALFAGYNTRSLSCLRPEEMNKVEAESRRFFIGGCHLLEDLDILVKPQMQDTNFRFVASGSIDVRWNVVTQTHMPSTEFKTPEHCGTSSASAVLLGADAVLKQYKKAKARLAAATRDLDVKCNNREVEQEI